MPYIYKYTVAIEGLGHGASETLYFQRDDDDVTRAIQSVQDVTGKRARLLGSAHYIKATRVQLVYDLLDNPVVRRGQLRKFGPALLPGTASNPSEDSGTSLQVQMSNSVNTRKKLLFLSGPWARIFPNGDSYDPNQGAWLSYFNQWTSEVIGLGMGWLGDAANPTKIRIDGYAVNADTGLVTFTLAAPGITWDEYGVPKSITVDFPLTKSPLDGTYLVWPINPTTFITAQPRPAAPFSVPGNCWINSTEFVGLAVLNNQGQPGTITGQNPVSRKRGRPLYSSLGRQPRTVRW